MRSWTNLEKGLIVSIGAIFIIWGGSLAAKMYRSQNSYQPPAVSTMLRSSAHFRPGATVAPESSRESPSGPASTFQNEPSSPQTTTSPVSSSSISTECIETYTTSCQTLSPPPPVPDNNCAPASPGPVSMSGPAQRETIDSYNC